MSSLLVSIGEISLKVGALLSFRAFRPELKNHQHTLPERMRGKRIALLNLGPAGAYVSSAILQGGKLVLSEINFLPCTSVTPELCQALELRTDCKSVAVALTTNSCLCDLLNLGSAPAADIAESLVRDPALVLGRNFEAGRKYHVIPHPDLISGLVMSVADQDIARVEQALERNNLTVLRTQLGIYCIMNQLLASDGLSAPLPDKIVVPLVLEQGYGTSLNIYKGNWGPREALAHRQLLGGRNGDAFEQRDAICSYLEETAGTIRRFLMRAADFPVEFAVVESNAGSKQYDTVCSHATTLKAQGISLRRHSLSVTDDLVFSNLIHK